MSSVRIAKGLPPPGGEARKVVAEKRPQHDLERDFAHVLRDVDCVRPPPPRRPIFSASAAFAVCR